MMDGYSENLSSTELAGGRPEILARWAVATDG